MIDIKVDLHTATAVRIGESWHAIEPGTLTIGRAVFFVPDAGPGDEGAWVSGAGYNPLSFSCTGTDGKRRVGPLSSLTYIVHETPEPCTKGYRRPECADGHTDDCEYEEPEPPHELLPVGTRVLVSDWHRDSSGHIQLANPVPGRISGYDSFRSKYRWQREWEPGRYSTHDSWAFVDNRVVVHPDGPECPPSPQPVKQEPTGPRVYVQNQRGKQGYIVAVRNPLADDVVTEARVQWFTPGARPVWRDMRTLTVIAPEDVERCPNGQTGDECASGENQCELCLQAEDEEADAIERSMGL